MKDETMIETESDELIPLSHPGVTLFEDVMEPLKLTAYALAKALEVPVSRIDDIVAGRRRFVGVGACFYRQVGDVFIRLWNR